MKKLLGLLIAGLSGCAAIPNETSGFYRQEGMVAQRCLSTIQGMPFADQIKIDSLTGRSPFSNSARCYASQIDSVLTATGYKNSKIVQNFASYLVDLTEARDKGLIDNRTAINNYGMAAAQFREMLKIADERRQAEQVAEFRNKLDIFIQQLNAVVQQQEALRTSNRPILCTGTGVFKSNSIICQ